MAIQKTPDKLIDSAGRPNVGIFDAPLENLNYSDFIRPGAGKPVSHNRIKRWEYIGIVSKEYILGGAVVSLNFMGNAFFYVWDREKKRLKEFSFLAPFCRGIDFGSNGVGGRISFRKGSDSIEIVNDRRSGKHALEVKLKGLELSAALEDGRQPMSYVGRVGYAGFNYTLKLAGLPASGVLKLDGETHSFAGENAFGVIDYTTGCLARDTFWNWASGGGRDREGNVIGINLVLGVNESGVTENAFWIGNRLVKVDTVNFSYNQDDILGPWTIKSWDGKVDLKFIPEGQRFENTDLKLLVSKFHQPFGRFEGTLTDDDGVKHKVKELYGYTEEHFARW